MNEQEFAELSAGHALGALSPDDERRYQEALLARPEWQEIVRLDLDTVGALGDSVTPVAPPLNVRSRLLSQIRGGAAETPEASVVGGAAPLDPSASVDDTVALDRGTSSASFAEPSASDAPLPEVPRVDAAPPTEVVQAIQRRNWTRGLFALVASVALLVGIGWGVGAISDSLRTPPAVQLLAQIESQPDAQSVTTRMGEDGQASLHWSESLGEAVFVAKGMPEIAEDRTFELWFVRDDTPIAAGTFDASDGEATAQLVGSMKPGDTIAVTVEQRGGSPDGKPTTDPIVAVPSETS